MDNHFANTRLLLDGAFYSASFTSVRSDAAIGIRSENMIPISGFIRTRSSDMSFGFFCGVPQTTPLVEYSGILQCCYMKKLAWVR